MNTHQTIEEILRSASPAQKILWNDLFLRFGERIAASQMYYLGDISTGEIGVYVARKIFLAYDLIITNNNPQSDHATAEQYQLYDENNTANLILGNSNAYWNTTGAAAKYLINSVQMSNLWFSRIAPGAFPGFIRFIGYRITF
jgi:hypothetical protein